MQSPTALERQAARQHAIDTSKGTEGRVYGGNPDLIHVPDGNRAKLGRRMAGILDDFMRVGAEDRTEEQRRDQLLCPGCYMVVVFDMLLALADANGQPRRELALSMREAFDKLARDPGHPDLEEIHVNLDPENAEPSYV